MTDSPLQDTINKYFPYLLEIRKRLLFIASLFIVAAIAGFFYYEKIIALILTFLNLKGVNIVFTSPFQFFSLAINSGVFVGVIAIFPLLVYQLLTFIKPALNPKEYRLITIPLPLSIILFVIGFAYGVNVMKYVVTIFYQKSLELHIGNVLDIELLLNKIIMTSLLMGLSFQFPIIMSVLLHLKTIKLKSIYAQRPFVYAGSMLFVMLLPPTDIMSDFILFLPLVFLFELTLVLNRFLLKKAR